MYHFSSAYGHICQAAVNKYFTNRRNRTSICPRKVSFKHKNSSGGKGLAQCSSPVTCSILYSAWTILILWTLQNLCQHSWPTESVREYTFVCVWGCLCACACVRMCLCLAVYTHTSMCFCLNGPLWFLMAICWLYLCSRKLVPTLQDSASAQ